MASLIKEPYFISDRLERYLSYLHTYQLSLPEVVTNVNCDIDYPFYTNTKPSNLSYNYLLLVNKYHYLDNDTLPLDLVTMTNEYDNQSGDMLSQIAYSSFQRLVNDAEKEEYHIRNNSVYRDYYTQEKVYNSYRTRYRVDYADRWAARSGYSEHQTGLSLDVGVANSYNTGVKFENTKEFSWMKDNCYKYGFILRFPKNKEHLTGVNYESWHYRYVGEDAATYIYQNDITFEEYYAYFVEKKEK